MSVQRVLAMLEARIAALEDQSGRTNRPQSDECRQLIGELKERIGMLEYWPSDPGRVLKRNAMSRNTNIKEQYTKAADKKKRHVKPDGKGCHRPRG